MPVKKKREKRPVHSDTMKKYLLSGVEPEDEAGWFEINSPLFPLDVAWEDLRDELLAEWIKDHPGRRPWAWWDFDSPGPRLRVGGKGDLIPATDYLMNLHLGIPRRDNFIAGYLSKFAEKYGRQFEAYDPADPPVYESQAAYLRRQKLFASGEEKRIPADAFDPEVVG